MQNWSLYCDVCFWNWLRPKFLHPSLTSKVSVPNRQLTQTWCTYHIVKFVQKRWWLNGTTRLDDPDLAPKLQRTRVLGKKPWNTFVPVASQYVSTIIIPFILHNKLNLSILEKSTTFLQSVWLRVFVKTLDVKDRMNVREVGHHISKVDVLPHRSFDAGMSTSWWSAAGNGGDAIAHEDRAPARDYQAKNYILEIPCQTEQFPKKVSRICLRIVWDTQLPTPETWLWNIG